MNPRLLKTIGLALLGFIAGCSSKEEAHVTFSKQIAPIIYDHCTACHRPGQPAPFSLVCYADARKHASDIAQVTATGYMPPWLPAPGICEFVGERHLSGAQIDLIAQWVKQGAIEGDTNDLPRLPAFPEGWQLGPPDLVVQMPKPYQLPPEGRDLYRNFVIPAPLKEGRFVRAFEFHPRNRAVHHVRIKFDPTRQSRRMDAQDPELGFPGMRTPGKFPPGHMTTWVPGQTPMPVAPGLQWLLDKDTDIILEIHLQRSGRTESIQPEIGFYFTNAPPSESSFLVGLTAELIDIPAGDANYTVERSLQLPVDVLALTILPHMHYLGRDIEAFADLPGGARQWLLRIPQWDFNWQGEYHYRVPVVLPAGSVLTMRCRYDNSAQNVRNPNQPPLRVVYGPQSTDEMAELWLQVIVRNPEDLAQLDRAQRHSNDEETIAFYKKQLETNPNDAAMHTAAGKVLGPMGRLDEAVEHFRAALVIAPGLAEAHYYLGLSLLTKHKTEDARREFEAALQADATYGKAHDGLGLIALQGSDTVEAEKQFRRALEINPDDAAARSNLEKLGVGSTVRP